MAKISKINFSNFRNFENFQISFNKKTNIFIGDNGSGKTNILEGISLISKGRGLRNSAISNLIKFNKKNFQIKCCLNVNENIYDIDVFTSFKENKIRKNIKINDDNSKESLNFLNSAISYLTFVPEMERLFQSSPSFRRNFIDRLIYSEKNDYNRLINRYKNCIIERAKILQQNYIDREWITQIENEISRYGVEIYKLRYEKLEEINKLISTLNYNNNYKTKISLEIKDVFFDKEVRYETFVTQLYSNRQFDKKFGGCKIGPHKSDIIAKINDSFDASQLSTGQQKTVVLMVLFAQCYHLINSRNLKPILLMDEICSHLDSNNRKILLDIIDQFEIQLFLTGTEESLFSFISTNLKFYNITTL